MPLDGWDYVELWVGNAKQAAAATRSMRSASRKPAYAGPETGVRDRASYVLEQGTIRFVLTSALREDHDIARHCTRHGDGVKDIALTVPDATEAYRQAVQRGARGTLEPQSPLRGRVRHRSSSLPSPLMATRFTLSSVVAATPARSSPVTEPLRGNPAPSGTAGVGLRDDRPHRGQRRARPHGRMGGPVRARLPG